MKRSIIAAFVVASLTIALNTRAADEKKTITGDGMCAKCELKQTSDCQMAIKVKNTDGTSDTLLVENNKIAQDFHNKICKQTKAVNGEGTISEKDGKKTVTLSKIYLSK